MKTKRIVALVIVVFHLCIMNTLNASDSEQDVVVRFPPELGITQGVENNNYSKEEEVMDKLRKKIPSAPIYYGISTIGQLVKQVDVVMVGQVKRLTSEAKLVGTSHTTKYGFDVKIVDVLYGQTKKKNMNLVNSLEVFDKTIIEDDYVLLFLSGSELTISLDIFDFQYVNTVRQQNKKLLLLGYSRGVIRLHLPYKEDEVYKAVTNYISILRCEKRDSKRYYDFLKNVTKTQNRRLIEDGNSDMLFLLRTCDEINLYELLNDEELDPNIKEYIRVVMIPHKENKLKQKAER